MANNDFDKTRNDYQQYDLVTVFKASESRVLRHLHVATMAVVTKVDGDTVQCMPFPIREGTTANNIYAYNIGKSEFKEGDKVLVIFTDRDFRKNYDSATTSERSIGTTNDAKLHSIDYGVVIPIAKQYEGSIEALREKVDNHISNSNNPHKVTKEQVNLGNVVNQGMDTTPTKGSGKYVTSGGVYNSIESVKSDLNATNEVVNQFEANYATKDYVVGNFANKYDTNKAIEAVSTKASNNETEISSIKENYVTKASADETYAKATETNTKLSEIDTKISDTNTKISDTNTNLSKTDAKVSTIEKNITDINTSLGTKQDKLSFGNGLSNTNNLIAVDFTKVQAKLSVGNGILFSNDTLSIDTSVIPTIEYLEAQGYAKATDVTKNAEAIAEIKKDYAKSSSIGNGKVVIKQNGTEKGSFTMNQGEATEINLTDTDTHVAVVNNLTSSSTTSALSAYQGNVLNGKISDTNKAVAGKQDAFTVGEGLTYASGVLAVDTSKFVGYTDYTEKMSSIDEKIATNAGSISTLNTDVSSLKTSTADNKKSIDTINKNLSSLYGRVDTNEKSISIINGNVSSLDTRVTTNENSISAINTNVSTLSKNVEDVTAKANASASSISSLDSRVTTNSEDIKTNKASITALSYKYGNGKAIARTAFDDTNTLAKEVFGDNYVDHSNLVVVRSTDPYNGDYFAQSWSSGLFWNQGDSWAGFTVGGRDYGKDVKFVVGGVGNKGNPLWTFDLITTLNIASQTVKSFTATEVNHGCKFNGDLQSTSLKIENNYFQTGGLNKVTIREKTGTLALLDDIPTIPSIPSVVDNLTSSSSSSALSANQGRVLNNSVSSLSSSISSLSSSVSAIGFLSTNAKVQASINEIGSTNSKTEPQLTRSTSIYGGTYGTFYTIWGYENGYKSDYGILAVANISTDTLHTTSADIVTQVSGEIGYWNPQWLSLSVFVPAGQTYYVYGARMTSVRYSYVRFRS